VLRVALSPTIRISLPFLSPLALAKDRHKVKDLYHYKQCEGFWVVNESFVEQYV
jgi:hypothetical protein